MLSLFYVFCLDISNGENGVLKLFFIENNFFREDFDQVLEIMLYDGTSSEETSSETEQELGGIFGKVININIYLQH